MYHNVLFQDLTISLPHVNSLFLFSINSLNFLFISTVLVFHPMFSAAEITPVSIYVVKSYGWTESNDSHFELQFFPSNNFVFSRLCKKVKVRFMKCYSFKKYTKRTIWDDDKRYHNTHRHFMLIFYSNISNALSSNLPSVSKN